MAKPLAVATARTNPAEHAWPPLYVCLAACRCGPPELCSAEEPFWLCRSMSQPWSSSTHTTLACPLSAAAGQARGGGGGSRPRGFKPLFGGSVGEIQLKCGEFPHGSSKASPGESLKDILGEYKNNGQGSDLHGVRCSPSGSLHQGWRQPPAAGQQLRGSRCWRRCRGGCSRWWWGRQLQAGRQREREVPSVPNCCFFCFASGTGESASAGTALLASGREKAEVEKEESPQPSMPHLDRAG